jgi:hypothetical protein
VCGKVSRLLSLDLI